MRKGCLTTLVIFICVNLFAQQAKPCLFIGLYDANKRGICSDREMVHEEIEDYFDYVVKSKAFNELHKTQNPNTRFIGPEECVITYRYEKEISGWKCNSNVVGIKTGKTLEDCNKQLADQQVKYPKDFTTAPNMLFTWQGKGKNKSEYSKDFGGVSGRFISVKGNGGKDLIVAKFRNKLKDKTAILLLQTDAGIMLQEYIKPGELLSKSFDTKKLEIQVIYQHVDSPSPFLKVKEFIKEKFKEQIINDKGLIKSTKDGSIGVRG